MCRYAAYLKFFTHPHWKREIRQSVTLRLAQFISIEAKLDACAGYVVYLFHNGERKLRTEGSFSKNGYAKNGLALQL